METQIDRLGTALAGRYTIERELGRGGMATVYLAQDLKHHRRVAIKVLKPELAAALGPERFLREIEIAAKLAHPHILPLYDSGEAGGFLHYVMPYVEGESLRDRLTREKQLPLEDALQIARQTADALSYAHSHDVVHRDIKPENILLEAGHAVVSDFGIARAITAAGGDELTKTGIAVGTPAYMGPEQASAEARIDGRADIYALGCVLYEMLAGEPPFAGSSAQAVLARHAVDPVPPLHTVRKTVPLHVERAVLKALEKTPADRFATAAQFAAALEAPGIPQQERSVAVLPFANLSQDPNDEYFSDGTTEEIITTLSAVKTLRIAARTSSFAFKGKNVDARTIGRQLNVGTVLEGSVRRAGQRLRITAQLINVADGFHIWSERYDRHLEDVFAIQDEIASNIARALKVVLTEAEPRAEKPATKSVEAYDYFLRGRQFFHQHRRKGFEAAIKMFERAVAVDPDYARAYAAMADSWSLLHHLDAQESYLREADAASRKAVDLAPELAEAHASRGLALSGCGRYEEAEREFEVAVQLGPNLFEAYYFHARASLAAGHLARAAELFRRAIEVRPEDYQAAGLLRQVYVSLGREAEATAAARLAVEKVERHLELHPYDARALYLGAGALARLGDANRADAWVKHALAIEPDDAHVLYNAGCVYSSMAKIDEALDVLERCARVGLPDPAWLEHDSDLDPLRDHPRFKAILAGVTNRNR